MAILGLVANALVFAFIYIANLPQLIPREAEYTPKERTRAAMIALVACLAIDLGFGLGVVVRHLSAGL